MSASHTLSIGPLARKVKGTKPLMALVNGKWEPISIKTTMLFPVTEMAILRGGANRRLVVEGRWRS